MCFSCFFPVVFGEIAHLSHPYSGYNVIMALHCTHFTAVGNTNKTFRVMFPNQKYCPSEASSPLYNINLSLSLVFVFFPFAAVDRKKAKPWNRKVHSVFHSNRKNFHSIKYKYLAMSIWDFISIGEYGMDAWQYSSLIDNIAMWMLIFKNHIDV